MKEKMKRSLNLFELKKRSMTEVSAGRYDCCCACAWADQGGSSNIDNDAANDAGDLVSPECWE